MRALTLDSKISRAFLHLGECMLPGRETARVGGRELSSVDCFAIALERVPRNADAWLRLGYILHIERPDEIATVNGAICELVAAL